MSLRIGPIQHSPVLTFNHRAAGASSASRKHSSPRTRLRITAQTRLPSPITKNSMGDSIEKRFAIFLTGEAPPYSQKKYGGYGQMFIDLLKEPGDAWTVFRVLEGVFPDKDQLNVYDAFVITGSRYDAHGQDEWILKLCELLRSLHDKRRKVLGVCFGHQVLAHALGGKTGRASVGWELGVREVKFTEAFASKSYASYFPPVLKVIESHQDQVSEIPPDAELLGSSERTVVEIFAVGDHVLAIQGHPEFKEDVILDLIDIRLALGLITEDLANSARASVQKLKPDRDAWQKICKDFIRKP